MTTPGNASRAASFKFDISTLLPEGHEKAFKQAFYNVAAIVFVLFILVAGIAVYYVLEPFLRPLLWAVLFGSVLHPFKHRMTVIVNEWLVYLRATGTPLTLGALTCPFLVVDHVSERLWCFTLHYASVLLGLIGVTAATFLIYSCLPTHALPAAYHLLVRLLTGASELIELCQGASMLVWTLVVGYVVAVSLWWSPRTQRYLTLASPFVWTALLCLLVSAAGNLRLTLLLLFFALMLIGLIAEIRARWNEQGTSVSTVAIEPPLTPMQAFRSGLAWFRGAEDTGLHLSPDISTTEANLESAAYNSSTPKLPETVHVVQETSRFLKVRDITKPNISSVQSDTQEVQVDSSTPEKKRRPTPPSRGEEEDEKMSNVYIYGLLWLCFLVQLYRHMWLCYLLFVPCLYMGVKHAVLKFGLVSLLKEKLASWRLILEQRKDALVPAPLRGLWKLLCVGDTKFLELFESSVDTVTSTMAIFIVFFFALIGTIFLCVQIYGESMHLVGVTSGLINRTMHDTDLQQLVPESLRDVHLESVLDDAFLYGRGWISATVRTRKNDSDSLSQTKAFPSLVRRIIDGQNEQRAAELERQILEVFDKVYELWHSRNNESAPSPNMEPMAHSFDSLIDGLKTLNVRLIVDFVKENIGTFLSVLESVWVIVKGNISLAFSAITAILSLLFGGGTALLNFVLNFIVFSTSLFYLLCASGSQYKPVEAFGALLPTGGGGAQWGRAVEEAVNGVFVASFKMAAFYGLYTWFIHTVFAVKIVYIPSVLAAIFGAVPFLGAYWACLPAVLELWLVNGQVIRAVIMFVVQLLPTSCVDSAVYSEIKGGGHPYLTGLAIAGGVFYSGFEGALFGPMLLCVLFVAMHMYGSLVIQPGALDTTRRHPFSLKRMFTADL